MDIWTGTLALESAARQKVTEVAHSRYMRAAVADGGRRSELKVVAAVAVAAIDVVGRRRSEGTLAIEEW